MVERYIEGVEERIRELFSRTVLSTGDNTLAESLMYTDLYNTYRILRENNVSTLTPYRFLPPELVPYLDLSVESLSSEELRKNVRRRTDARQEFTKKAIKDPAWFVDVINRLNHYETNPCYDPQADILYGDLIDAEKRHSDVTSKAAYLILAELWRDVSLKLVGRGNYIIGFTPSGVPISRRIKESPYNKAALNEASIKWQNLSHHALSFFELTTLDKLVMDNDIWSDLGVISGYPYIADADKLADQMLKNGYKYRERYNPLPHEFPIEASRKSKYKDEKSIASVTVIDLNSPHKGLEYLIRHVDDSISAGKIFLPERGDRFRILQSNLLQYMQEKPEDLPLTPFLGSGLLVAAISRDMMVYKNVERNYRVSHVAEPSKVRHNGQGTFKWLPLFRVVYNLEPSKAMSEYHRLGELIREVSSYWVSRHPMRLPSGKHPSPKQLQLAAAEDCYVPPGSTFVRGHRVGEPDETMVQQYKSRSATAVLFGTK